MRRPHRLRPVLPLLLVGALLAGCGGGGSGSVGPPGSSDASASAGSSPSASSTPAVSSYVALGDSYTSAPYVRQTDVAGGCLRSDHNYPSLLAQRLGLSGSGFRDVSCAGAVTGDLTAATRTFAGQQVPAQLDAVRRDTALVTLGIGGNDFGLFGDLAGACVLGRGGGAGCGQVDVSRARTLIPRIGTRVATVLRAIERKAPDARVVLVGYPRIVEASRSCPSQLPLDRSAREDLQEVNRGLDSALAAAARRTGADFVDMYAAGKGHDVCAGADAWVNGVRTDTARAAALHPFLSEQQAVATRVLALLPRR